jgi:cell division transport system permease protein
MKQKKKHTIDVQFVTASISTSLVLLLLGMVALIILSANSLSVYVRENLELSLLLHEGTTQSQVDALTRKIEKMQGTKEVTYISKEDILAQETKAMGTDPSEFLGFNPYTASIEVRLKADYANNDSIALMENELSKETCISEINYPHDLVNNINDNIQKIGMVLLVLAIVLGFISFALINNTIKLTIYSQRFLLHTMKLVGAEWGFIRRPFMVRNLWTGLTAGMLALTLTGGGLYAFTRYEPMLTGILSTKMLFIVAGTILLFGVLITLFSARVSINRFLRMKAGDLYYI